MTLLGAVQAKARCTNWRLVHQNHRRTELASATNRWVVLASASLERWAGRICSSRGDLRPDDAKPLARSHVVQPAEMNDDTTRQQHRRKKKAIPGFSRVVGVFHLNHFPPVELRTWYLASDPPGLC